MQPDLHPSSVPTPTGLAHEAFAIAAVVDARDSCAKAPRVALPFDAYVFVGGFTTFNSAGEGDLIAYQAETCIVVFEGDWARFDEEIGPRLVGAIAVPSATTVLFSRVQGDRGQQYPATLVQTPPIISTSDVASARAVQLSRFGLNVKTGKTTTRSVPAVGVELTGEGADKLSAWSTANPGRPVAYIGLGRVVQVRTAAAKSIVLELDGQTTADAEALARAIAK
jgi:hypothetical protein